MNTLTENVILRWIFPLKLEIFNLVTVLCCHLLAKMSHYQCGERNSLLISYSVCVYYYIQHEVTCAAAAGRSRSPSGSRCLPCWVSVRGRCRERPAERDQNSQGGTEVLGHVQTSRYSHSRHPRVIYTFIFTDGSQREAPQLTRCTFCFLGRISAHGLGAVEAVSFDTVQIQRLGVLTDAVDLVSDPFKGHDLAL